MHFSKFLPPIFDPHLATFNQILLHLKLFFLPLPTKIGFEPNSHHTDYLKEVESRYQQCGCKVKILTKTAASDRQGTSRFYSKKAYNNMDWGEGILPPNVNPTYLGGVKMTPSAINAFVTQKIEKKKFKKTTNAFVTQTIEKKI